jgi:transcriptional regulator with XRE-family HTH domain
MTRTPATPLGGRLRALRRSRSITLQDLARDLGVHFTTVSAWERGRSEPDYDSLRRLAARLGVGAAELLGEAAPERPKLRLRVWGAARWGDFRARTEALQVAAATGAACAERPGLADLIDLMSRHDIERAGEDPASRPRQRSGAGGPHAAADLEERLGRLAPAIRSGVLELLAEWLDLFGNGAEKRSGGTRGREVRKVREAPGAPLAPRRSPSRGWLGP